MEIFQSFSILLNTLDHQGVPRKKPHYLWHFPLDDTSKLFLEKVYAALIKRLNSTAELVDYISSAATDKFDNKLTQENFDEKLETIFDNAKVLTKTHHPAHVYDEKQNVNPSSFIPLCQLDGTFVGPSYGKNKDESFPACDLFQPIVYEEEMCFTITNKMLISKLEENPDPVIELLLVINPNFARSFASENSISNGNGKDKVQ